MKTESTLLAHALVRGFVSLAHPRMLLLMIWPVMVSLLLWVALALAFWARAAQAIDAALRQSALVELMFEYWPLALIAAHIGAAVLALVFVPLVLVTAVLIIGMFAMPIMVNHVAGRDYPELDRRRGGTAAGSAWNSLASLAWLAALALVTLPLWCFPLFWPVLPPVLLGYLNQRVFRYDALCEHASEQELALIVHDDRGPLFGLGLIVALAGHVPVLGFFAPVYGALAFIHYGLGRLRELRSAPIEGASRRASE
ncbi:MAG: EI24 domain-containing protein [Betaproteobacteria bacterium]|nr:EI24 domain-containing protein [Betaproteobacteria bacterium]